MLTLPINGLQSKMHVALDKDATKISFKTIGGRFGGNIQTYWMNDLRNKV